jgi:hypothetical protein
MWKNFRRSGDQILDKSGTSLLGVLAESSGRRAWALMGFAKSLPGSGLIHAHG